MATVLHPLPQDASRHALSILGFPDSQSRWVVVLDASLKSAPPDLGGALARLHAALPFVGARLVGETWLPGPTPEPRFTDGSPLEQPWLTARFDLVNEPPLRVAQDIAGQRLCVAGHHAAFDGRALAAVLASLLGGPVPAHVTSPPPGPTASRRPMVARCAWPAVRVACSASRPANDSFASRSIELSGSRVTDRLAGACVRAVHRWNRSRSAPAHKIGVSIAIGGPAGVGNVASYRRVDILDPLDAQREVRAALEDPHEPGEQVNASWLLRVARPIVNRLSDTVLVSNLGRQQVKGVRSLDFYPVARGRSAVAFGAATPQGGSGSLTIRARDLDPIDADALLEDVIDAFVNET